MKNWKTIDMPKQNDTFILERSFTPKQMNILRKGNKPKSMDDKWFWYMENNTLYMPTEVGQGIAFIKLIFHKIITTK